MSLNVVSHHLQSDLEDRLSWHPEVPGRSNLPAHLTRVGSHGHGPTERRRARAKHHTGVCE